MSLAFLDAIMTTLQGAGLVNGTSGWAGRKLQMPTSPDQVAVIYSGPGLGPEAGKRRPTYQVAVRGARGDVDGPYNRADLIRAALDGAFVAGFSLFVSTQDQPFGHGVDDATRHIWSVNFRAYEE